MLLIKKPIKVKIKNLSKNCKGEEHFLSVFEACTHGCVCVGIDN